MSLPKPKTQNPKPNRQINKQQKNKKGAKRLKPNT